MKINSRYNEAILIIGIKQPFFFTRTLVYFLIFATILVLLFFAGCKTRVKQNVVKDPDLYYTCSMHPNVMEEKPGNCPICGMKLIEAKKSQTQKPDEIQLSDGQILLGNIRVDTLKNGSISDNMVLTATLNFDQSKTSAVSAKIGGRIDKLYFKNTGDYIHKGDKLFDLYSEELNNEKQEYVNALQNQHVAGSSLIDYDQLAESAKNKLLLWGMSESQISELTNTPKASPLTSFYSNASGYITTLSIKGGDYVTEGATIIELADLSTLWAEAQVYTSQLPSFDSEGRATVKVPDLNNYEINGKIEFVNPEVNAGSRINLIRITIPNTNNRLHPGMSAYVYIKNKQHTGLTVPANAVLRNGNSESVWVKTGEHSFKVKMVQTGIEDNNNIEIISGLQIGDAVVISGTYLLNSEYIFKRGSNPMSGMDMSKMKM